MPISVALFIAGGGIAAILLLDHMLKLLEDYYEADLDRKFPHRKQRKERD